MFETKLTSNSLLKKAKDKISVNIFKETLKKFGNNCVLIVDNKGSHFLNNFFTVTEIIDYGIISIESIYFKRKPYENYEAIYVISACDESLQKMSNDFIGQKEPIYKSCHVFTLEEINEDLIKSILTIHKKKNFIKYLKTLKQIMISFVPIDKNKFSFGKDGNFNSLYDLYNYENSEITKEINISKLISVCQCLDNYPNIVYFSPDKYCKLIAEKVNLDLKEYFTKKKKTKKNGILLITTRFIDFTAPIQFGLNYQHILLELIKKDDENYINKVSYKDVKNDKDNINSKNKKNNKEIEVILDYKNEIYNKYKNMSISEVFKRCDEDFKEFLNSDIGKLHNIKKDKEIDASFALKNVSKYHYYVDSYTQQINLCKEVNSFLSKRNIMSILDIQKNIISRLDNKGKKISDKDITSLIKDNKNLFQKNDLKRLLCLIKYYFPKIAIDKLINDVESNKIKFTSNDKNLINFFDQGKCLINADIIEQLDKSLITYREKNNYETKEEQENEDDKCYPYIKESKLTTLCDMCSKSSLPKAFFSFVEKPENLPQKKIKINLGNINSKEDEDDDNSNQDLILFNIGGLSNFEIASIEKGLSNGQIGLNLILGANKIYNHEGFCKEITNHLEKKKGIITVKEKIPKEIEDKKEKENQQGKIAINNLENTNISEGKHSRDKLDDPSGDSEDMR